MSQQQAKSPSGLGRMGPLMIVAVCLLGYFVLSRSGGAMAGWSTSYEEATASAQASQKPLLIAFHSDNCPPCYAMERTVLGEAPVVAALQDVVPVKVNLSYRPELGTKYDVPGTPTYTLLSPDGDLIGQTMGYVATDEFIAFLAQAKRLPSSAESAVAPPTDP